MVGRQEGWRLLVVVWLPLLEDLVGLVRGLLLNVVKVVALPLLEERETTTRSLGV